MNLERTPTPERPDTPEKVQNLPVINECTTSSSRESSVEKEWDSERTTPGVERVKMFGEEVEVVKSGLTLSQAEVESAMIKVCYLILNNLSGFIHFVSVYQ